MIDPRKLLSDLQAQQKKLEADLREQIKNIPELKTHLEAAYKAAFDAGRTADTFGAWSDNEITQAAVAWLLACTYIRFCEDNRLIAAPMLAGSGDALRRAKDAASEYFRQHPTENERHYLEHCFDQMASLPVVAGLFDRAHNPLFALPLSFEAARALLAFWQKVDPDTGALLHDFQDEALNTRFLGDLYQDLSEAARKHYALLQTPEFVEEFILDRTLEPAIQTFGLKGIRMIDPTCGSGHFLLGAFQRLLVHWQKAAPGLDRTEHVKHALDGVYGVDLNPFALAIARFRLLVAAIKACGIHTLKEARGWHFNLTTGDSLLHGRRFDQLDLGADNLSHRYQYAYAAEDIGEINRILGQQYHAVVGNPPYITASDKALNLLYRERYKTCHRKFSLGVPFTERFFQLALHSGNAPAGYVGLITADSFMKREFGKKLIEDYLPHQDLTHLIHTSGAYIPGHGTPTVILLGRNRAPVADTVRAVLGIRGEPSTPADPAHGLVWSSIIELTDQPSHSNDYISVSDMERTRLATHPWSLQGGGAPAVLERINSQKSSLGGLAEHIGIGAVTGCDDALLFEDPRVPARLGLRTAIPLVVGDAIRDWTAAPQAALSVYDSDWSTRPLSSLGQLENYLWLFRSVLNKRKRFGTPMVDRGLPWYEFQELYTEKLKTPNSITFAFVATHNHFVLDRGGKVFNRSAPVIKLPAEASEDEHLRLLGLLNSSTACFWMKQVFHNKGSTVDAHGARQTTVEFENFYEHTSTGMQLLPLSAERPVALARELDKLAQQRARTLPGALTDCFPLTRAEVDAACVQANSLLAQMIALQEELDWWCYHAYGLLDEALCIKGTPPEVHLGERAFEIVLARRMANDGVETTWFARHGSTPITELPAHWQVNYRALVERRIALIESNDWIGLLERPEYKRRWNQSGWDELEQAALKSWLLDRLEAAGYWAEPVLRRVVDLTAHAERDSDFMAVAALYTGQPGFDVPALILALLKEEFVPALKLLRYKDSGLRKRADWEQTWQQQRHEDAIDAEVVAAHPRFDDEPETEWQARIKPQQDQRKAAEIGPIPAPPKYASADFLTTTLWRLRGGLDVPKERFFSVPDPESPSEWLYGWAGWNPVQRVRALAGAYIYAEQSSGADALHLIPLLAAIQEELPWVLQWHNAMDPEMDVRPGDYFRSWLGEQLNRHGWTQETLDKWRPVAVTRGRRARQTS